MRKARVAVYAPDSITLTGLTTFLSGRPDFTVVPAAGADCDVLAVITDEVSSEVLAMLRRWANTVERATPVVLVTDDLRTDDLLTLVECRVVGSFPGEPPPATASPSPCSLRRRATASCPQTFSANYCARSSACNVKCSRHGA